MHHTVSRKTTRKTISIVAESDLSRPILYGQDRATIELARFLASTGEYEVIVASTYPGNSGSAGPVSGENFFALTADSIMALAAMLKASSSCFTCIIEISALNFVDLVCSDNYIVYQHSPCPPVSKRLPAVQVINLLRIPVVCVSQHAVREQVGFGIAPSLLHFIHNGCHSVTTPDSSPDKPRDNRSILFAGLITPFKGVDVAISAFQMLQQRYHDARLTICGANRCDWNDARDHLQSNWIRSDGSINFDAIQEEIGQICYRGEVSQDNLRELFRSHSLLVMPSQVQETFGLVSIEAQAEGCIPVLPAIGGLPETILDDISGFLYMPNTAQDLAMAIDQLWRQNLPTNQNRSEARRWVGQQFSWKKTGQAFQAIISMDLSKSNRIMPYLRKPLVIQMIVFLLKTMLRMRLILHRVTCTERRPLVG